MKKRRRGKNETKIDGLGPKDVEKIRGAIRKVWHWCYAKKLATARATSHKDGFPRCESCNRKAPKIFIDHIVPVGSLDEGFIKRLFCSSEGLQALCKACHQAKTNEERRVNSAIRVIDGYLDEM